MKSIVTVLAFLCFNVAQGQGLKISLLNDINASGGSNEGTRNYTAFNNKVYFTANDGIHGIELWSTDGSTNGTQLVKDIKVGTDGSIPDQLKVCNGKLFFSADDGIHGVELWISDGTSAGTKLLKDVKYGYNDSYPLELTVMNNKIYFSADDSVHAREPWVSDGTTVGTLLLADINQDPDYQNSDPLYFTLYNNKLYFQANNQTEGTELWVSDGTTNGTMMLKDINTESPSSGSGPMSFCVFKDKLYFKADEGNNGNEGELWMTDGTEAGTVLVKNIRPTGNASADHLIVFNGSLYFTAVDTKSNTELYKSDGTTAGTGLFKDINPGTDGSFPDLFKVYNNKLYFVAQDATGGSRLYISDGTEAGTTIFKDMNGNSISDPGNLTQLGSQLYFRAYTGSDGAQIWSTNGTSAGTKFYMPANPKSDALGCTNEILPFNGSLYFSAEYGTYGCEVYKLDSAVTTGLSDEAVLFTDASVYPNPGKGIFYVKTANFENALISVYDVTGNLVSTQFMQNEVSVLNLEQVMAGIYQVRISKNNVLIHQSKIIKQ